MEQNVCGYKILDYLHLLPPRNKEAKVCNPLFINYVEDIFQNKN